MRIRAFVGFSALLVALGVIEVTYASVLAATVPAFPPLDPGMPAEAYAVTSRATRDVVEAWKARPGAQVVAFFWIQVGGVVNAEVIERYNRQVPEFVAEVRVSMAATITIALVWIVCAIAGLRRRALATRVVFAAAMASTLTTPIVSQPLFGRDLLSLFQVWQLPGLLLALLTFLLAPREIAWTARAAAWSQTRTGAIVWAIALVGVSVLLTAGAFAAAGGLGAASAVIATGPLFLGVRLVVRAFRPRRSVPPE